MMVSGRSKRFLRLIFYAPFLVLQVSISVSIAADLDTPQSCASIERMDQGFFVLSSEVEEENIFEATLIVASLLLPASSFEAIARYLFCPLPAMPSSKRLVLRC